MFETLPRITPQDYVHCLCEIDRAYLDQSLENSSERNPFLAKAVEALAEGSIHGAEAALETEFPELYQRLTHRIRNSYLTLLAMIDQAAARPETEE